MRIKQLEITNFGKFQQQTFDLAADLTVFVGANEAGKSTIAAFVEQVIFGFVPFKQKSLDNYEFKRNSPDFGGKITFSAGPDLWRLERFKTTNNKTGELKVFKNDQQVPENLFYQQLKQIDRQFYRDTFLFNNQTLTQILSLNEANLVEQINVLGASDSAHLTKISQDFEKRAGVIYTSGARAERKLNLELKTLDQLKFERESKADQTQEYQALTSHINELTTQKQENSQKLAQVTQELNDARRLANKFQNYQSYLLQEAELIPDFSFDPDDYQEAVNNETVLSQLQNQLVTTTTNLENLKASQIKELPQIEQLLQKWPQVQNQAQVLEETEQQIVNKSQLNAESLRAQPVLADLQNYSEADLQTLQTDYQKLVATKVESQVAATTPPSGTNLLLMGVVGVVLLLVVGVILKLSPIILVMIAVLGFGFVGFKYNQQQQEVTKAKQQQREESAWQQSQQEFSAKYHLQYPLELNQLILTSKQVQARTAEIADLNQKKQTLQAALTKFLAELANVNSVAQLTLRDFTKVPAIISQLQMQAQKAKEQAAQAHYLTESLQTSQHELDQELLQQQQLFQKNKVKDFHEFKELAKTAAQQNQLQVNLASLREVIGADMTSLSNDELDLTKLQAQISELETKTQVLNTEQDRIMTEIAQLKSDQNNLTSDQELLHLEQRIAQQETKILASLQTYLSLALNAKWLTKMLSLASHNRFPKMQAAASKFFAILTNQRYQGIDFGDKTVRVISADHAPMKNPYQLSKGTSEQLYFALKLAFVLQINDEINLPIMIDDAFVDFDQGRIQNMTTLIAELLQSQQVIIFTQRQDLADSFEQATVINL